MEPYSYGNGGIKNEVNWEGYEFDKINAEQIELQKQLGLVQTPKNKWVVVCNPNAFQVRNKLFSLSREDMNLDLRLLDLGIAEIHEDAALRIYGDDHEKR